MNKKKLRLRVIISLGTVISMCAVLAFFSKAGTWLIVNEPVPAHLDVLFTFGGENARVTYSRGLMERLTGTRWVLSDYFHQYSRILSREGFAMSRVAIVDTCRYTISEVKGLAGWLNDNKNVLVRSTAAHDTAGPPETAVTQIRVGLVSTPFHMRRIKFMVEDVLRDTAFHCYYLPVPVERYGWTNRDLRLWWRSKAIRTWVVSETGKLLWYWLFT
jgi:hypothetical protein